jgi:hypothetical protein
MIGLETLLALGIPAASRAIDLLLEELAESGNIDRVKANHQIAKAKATAMKEFRRQLMEAQRDATDAEKETANG